MIYTIGHSTRPLEELIKVLKHYKIERLIDIRHFPRSRHNSQFNKETLEKELPEHGINYFWLEKLGGFRKGGYKKYMKTKEWQEGFKQLMELASRFTVAIMCAEILHFKCHRRFVADALKRANFSVLHIYDENKAEKHLITKKRRKIRCD